MSDSLSGTVIHRRSSIETSFNVANTMMGTALLVMPVNFYKTGIVTSVIGAIVLLVVSYWTCNLCVIHSRDDEIDYPSAIKRLLGRYGEICFNCLSMFLLMLVAIIHFILMANVLYAIIINFQADPHSFPAFDEISFSKFSMQYTGIILFFLCAFIYCIKDLSIILKINDKGIYMILTFTIFIIYLGAYALATEDITFKTTGCSGYDKQGLDIVLFNLDVTEIIGVFSLAYMVHNNVVGLMKENKNSAKNSRDLLVAYVIVFVKYTLLGIMGSFSIAAMINHTKGIDISKDVKNIMTFLIDHDNTFIGPIQRVFGLISLIFIFIQLTTVLPILNFFTRRQFFGLLHNNEREVKRWEFHTFNIIFNCLCLGFEIFVFEPITVISYTGAFGGFFLIYVLPISLHIKCLYWDTPTEDIKQIELTEDPHIQTSLNNSDLMLGTPKENECRRDHTHEKLYNRTLVFAGYGFLVLFGLGVLISTLYSIIVKPKCTQ